MKKETFEIKNLSDNAKDQLIDQFQVSLIKHLKIERVLFCLVLAFAGTLFYVANSPAMRFAIIHQNIATKYAADYYKVETASKEAAAEVITSWVESGRIK